MSGSQRRSGGSSNGSGRNGGGGRSSSSRGHSYTNFTSGGGASTLSTQSNGYDPRNDSVYAQVQRSSWSHHAYPNGAGSNQASYTTPPTHTQRPQVQQPRAYDGPHQSETIHSSSHLRISPRQFSESDFHSSPPPHASSSAERRAQPDPYQPPIAGYPYAQTAPQRSGPYDAVGYIRRNGAVYDEDEVYEEYRPYDPYAHQHGQQRFNGSK